MFSLLIKNATVVDGTGKPGEVFDVAAQGDQIVNIAPNIETNAQVVIDAKNKILCPGFIDMQNHSDSYWQIFDNPSLDSLITQGYTTLMLGNCGASLAPLLTNEALQAMQKWHNLDGINVNWQSFSEFIEEISRKRFACNVGSLVGYSTLRRAIVGDQVRGLLKPEMEALKRVLEESLDAGAFGLSSGLSYAHEIIISELELFELAKIVSRKKGLFSIHLRNEGQELIEALDEALDIARNAEVNLKISHFKARNKENWPKLNEAVEIIDTAFHQGTNVHFDLYPYEIMWQALYSYLPKWAVEGGRELMLKAFKDQTQRNKILNYLVNSEIKFSEIKVASTANKLNFAGKTIGQIAANMGTSSEQTVLNLIENGGAEVMVFENNLSVEQVESLLWHPLSFVATDGAGFSLTNNSGLVHPRSFGTTAKFLNLVLTKKNISLETAINKMTLGPANKLGLKKRGEIKIGNFADLVIFDPLKIKDLSTYENPYVPSVGIEHVFVNGKCAIENGKMTNQLSGYALRKT